MERRRNTGAVKGVSEAIEQKGLNGGIGGQLRGGNVYGAITLKTIEKAIWKPFTVRAY